MSDTAHHNSFPPANILNYGRGRRRRESSGLGSIGNRIYLLREGFEAEAEPSLAALAKSVAETKLIRRELDRLAIA
jgi:hypothetical protein